MEVASLDKLCSVHSSNDFALKIEKFHDILLEFNCTDLSCGHTNKTVSSSLNVNFILLIGKR